MKTLKVDFPRWIRLFLWLSIPFLGSCALASWIHGTVRGLPIFFLLLIALDVCMLLQLWVIEMNDEFIRISKPLVTFQLRWDEVERIEQWTQTVFIGKNGQLVLQRFHVWAGVVDKDAMMELMNRQIETRAIPVKRTFWADRQRSKGSRVKEV